MARILGMNTTLTMIGLVFATVGLTTFSHDLRGQTNTTSTTTTVQTTTGSFSEFVPNSNVVVLRSESNSAPMQYTITNSTRIVDAAGNPISMERIPSGSPLSVEYEASGGQMVAERIVVQNVTGAQIQTTVTTTTARPMTEEEVEAREEAAEEAAEAREEIREEIEDARD